MKSPKDFETFLNSLPKPEKGQAEDEAKLLKVLRTGADFGFTNTEKFLIKCLRHAKSLRVPEGLRESIKAAVLAGMKSMEHYDERAAFYALCAPDEVKG